MRVSAAGVEVTQPLAKKPRLRTVTVADGAEEVRVAARTATRIRFDTALDAARTRLRDVRGRFEPLLVGHGFLVVTPREELPAGEQVPLQVVLADGTELPFVLAANASEVDVQLRVRNPDPLRTWAPGKVRVWRDGGAEVEVLAVRMGPEALSPGGWGWLVIITGAVSEDASARFELELRGRSGALVSPPEGVAL